MSLFSTEKVLVPLDFSDEAVKVLKETLEFVEDPSKIYALYVLPPLEATDPGVVWQTVDDATRIKKINEMFGKYFPEAVYQKVNFVVEVGNPSSEIVDYAEANEITLIVIPSSGKAGLSRFFMGSVSEKVVRFTRCPVLVIH
ncbi:MAG: universal stress protein [Cyanobacteria bacterium P01_D01_bin.6]